MRRADRFAADLETRIPRDQTIFAVNPFAPLLRSVYFAQIEGAHLSFIRIDLRDNSNERENYAQQMSSCGYSNA